MHMQQRLLKGIRAIVYFTENAKSNRNAEDCWVAVAVIVLGFR